MHTGAYRKGEAFAGILLWCALGVVPAGGSSLGWYEKFASYTNNQPVNGINGWSGPLSVIVQTNALISRTNYAKVPQNMAVTNTFGVSAAKVWTDMFVQPIVGETVPTVPANSAVVFYFNSDYHPVVRSGASWVTVAAATINPNNWNRVTVFQNFQAQNWSLFVNGTYATGGLAFASSVNGYNSLAIEHAGVTAVASVYLDDMWVSGSRPDTVTNGSNPTLTNDVDDSWSVWIESRMPDAWELDYFGSITRERPGNDYDDDGCTDEKEYADGTDPTNPNSFLRNIPWREGFEKAAVGTLANGWHGFSYAGSVAVQASDRIEFNKALSISSGSVETASMTLTLTDGDATNVWCLIYSKPAFCETTPTSTNDSCAFYVAAGGVLRACSSNSWVDLMTGIPTNTWLGFAVHLDYLNTNWDLYVSTNGQYGASMMRANSEPLGFGTNHPANFTNVIVQTANRAYVDLVAVSLADTNAGVASLTNVLACDRMAGQRTLITRPPYDYTSGEDTLNGTLGADLSRRLGNYDKIKMYYTNTYAWNSYYWNVDSWQWESGLTAGNLHIPVCMGIALDRRGGMDDVAFYPYGVWTDVTDWTLYGTNSNMAGWNLLGWPYEPRPANSPKSWGLTNGIAGDRIFIYESGYYRDLYWKDSETKWKESGSDATYVLKPGQGMWYYRAANGTTNWPLSAIR